MNPKKRTYELIVEQINMLCLEQNLQPGDRLPSERDLASLFGVSRTSVREALKRLESKNILEIRQGGGSFLAVSKRDTLGNELRTHIDETHAQLIDEMLELRRAFEVEAASLAAKRATSENLEAIKHVLTQMAEATDDPELGVQADLDFHLQVAYATKNQLLIDLMETLANRMEENIRATRRQRFTDSSRHLDTLKEHEEIYLAIAGGNSDLARQLMDKHISRIRLELYRAT
ncbi:DNA-binding FadR family transcriptional regulator [Planomicrobium stackebrandtii]|uniref:DNA-binding FadR family transcriptional regulator n=1 Tax=Planomicrobium stackebrandtii TaxID=253160 RepID=A0ABU0GQ01_9BACL|nr:FadR/GntR family transcriptional regulator [Planomicrobium stackebrandtii]MDQ0427439.1 DNA-binding FadR family transcriptional regulator [Planomicrobium stackebrandtii]